MSIMRSDGKSVIATLATFLDRLTFVLLVGLALSFSFERVKAFITIQDTWVLTNVEILLIVTVGIWSLRHMLMRKFPQYPRSIALPMLAWLMALIASSLIADENRTKLLDFMSRITCGVLIGWIVYEVTYTQRRWRLVIQAIAICGVAITVLGLGEAFGIAPILDLLLNFRSTLTHVGNLVRISSALDYATIAAMIIEITTLPLLAWLLTTRNRWLRVIVAIALFAHLTALVLTLTRAALIGLIAALFVIAFIAYRHRLRVAWMGSLAAVVTVTVITAALFLINPTYVLRFISENDNSWYQAKVEVPASFAASPGELTSLPVTLTNTGSKAWNPDGSQPFNFSYHLQNSDNTEMVFEDGARTKLPNVIAPGQSVALSALVQAPSDSGEYVIEWDMVQETVTWFSAKGSPQAFTRLKVMASTENSSAGTIEVSTAKRTPDQTIGRLVLWQTALTMFRERPLLGFGPDSYRWLYGKYAGIPNPDTNLHANNMYIEWLVDTGLVGLAAFLYLSWSLFQSAINGFKQLGTERNPEAVELSIYQLALIGALVTWYVHGLLDFFFEFTPTYIAFWLVAGLAVRAAQSVTPARPSVPVLPFGPTSANE